MYHFGKDFARWCGLRFLFFSSHGMLNKFVIISPIDNILAHSILDAAIICGCLPHLNQLIQRFLDKVKHYLLRKISSFYSIVTDPIENRPRKYMI
jgi:uncharacterized membrane protein